MQAIKAYYVGDVLVPLVPIKVEVNQQVMVTIVENVVPEDKAFWDRIHDTLMSDEERRLAGAPTFSHEEVYSKLEERYRAAKGA